MINDNESLYDEEVAPLLEQIYHLCKDNQLPFFAVFQLNNKPLICTTYAGVEGEDDVFKEIGSVL